MIDIVDSNGPSSYATGINNKGQVVGNIYVKKMNNYSGFIWEKEKGLKDLKISKIESYAKKINDSGQMIGFLRSGKFFFIPKKSFSFFRTNLGLIVNLGKSRSINDKVTVESINNNNWIAGQIDSIGLKPQYQPVLLKPKQSKLKDLLDKIPWDKIKKIKGSKK